MEHICIKQGIITVSFHLNGKTHSDGIAQIVTVHVIFLVTTSAHLLTYN